MFETLHPGAVLAWEYFWQLTLFLGLGLAASLALRRRPARAHRFLLLAMLAALITPLLAQAARRGGWGMLPQRAAQPSAELSDAPVSELDKSPIEIARAAPPLETPFAGPRGIDPLPDAAEPRVASSPRIATEHVPPTGGLLPSVSWGAIALGVWLVLAGLSAARLMVSLWIGLRVVHRAHRLDNETLAAPAASAAERLGMGFVPELRASLRVRCPSIWCWSRRPVILLPDVACGRSPVDWVGVFCHELAHWVRRDHLSSLLAEVLTCILPWHPMAWWAKHRLGQLSELACDDWALATGLEATDYAESLLGLVPQSRGAMALAAVSSRRGLIGRVRHILTERRISPAVGRRWAILSAAAMVLAASAIALAQTRPVESQAPNSQSQVRSGAANVKDPAPANSSNPVVHHTIRGTVLGPEDKPVARATVLLVGYTKPAVLPSVMPRDRQDQRNGPREIVLASTDTGTDGRYALTAEVETADLNSLEVVGYAQGFGLSARYLKKFRETLDASRLDTTETTLHLAPEVPIHGRLLTPSGMPASGVQVTLKMIQANETQDGMHFGNEPGDERIRAHWPKPVTTNADGRFVLESVPRGTFAILAFSHPDYAVDEVTVSTSSDDATPPSLRALDITPVKPTFTYTLEPARPVQGRVTDKATGKPLAGLLVEMVPMRQHGGHSFYDRTDADGRYRISGHAGARWYITTVYSPADSGYLAPNNWQSEWPAGARFLEKDFALERAQIVRGRIIDAETKRPIVGAAAVYQPNPGNPHNNREYEFRNTVLSDKDGRFSITALPGEGNVLVEASSEYIRTKFLEGKSERTARFPHGLARVDVPETGEAAPIEITIRKGVTFTARVVGPDGKPIFPFAVYCREMDGNAISWSNTSRDYLDERLVFPGSDPSRTYKLVFVSARHQLAAVVDIKPDPNATQPAEIRLQPAARIHGKVVKPGGLPMTEGQVYPMIVLGKKPESMDRDVVLSQEFYSNLLEGSARGKYQESPGAQGEFTHDALVPGLPFYIVATSGGREAFQYVPPLRSGEDRDLGTITLEERKR